MTNSVIQKIVKLCGFCLTAVTVAFLLEVTFEIMYEKLGKTAEYNGVYGSVSSSVSGAGPSDSLDMQI